MPVNNREALIYFRKVAKSKEDGDANASRALAFCYLSGHGVEQSVERAAAILKTVGESDPLAKDFVPQRHDQASGAPKFADAVRSDFRVADDSPLPITGGWGYDRDHPIVFDLALDAGYEEGRPLDLHLLERLVIENRIFLECVMRAADRLSAVEWRALDREVIAQGDTILVHISLKVHGCPEWVWLALGRDWKMSHKRTPRSKADAHNFIHKWFLRSYTADCWIDISKIPEQFREPPEERQRGRNAAKGKKRR